MSHIWNLIYVMSSSCMSGLLCLHIHHTEIECSMAGASCNSWCMCGFWPLAAGSYSGLPPPQQSMHDRLAHVTVPGCCVYLPDSSQYISVAPAQFLTALWPCDKVARSSYRQAADCFQSAALADSKQAACCGLHVLCHALTR